MKYFLRLFSPTADSVRTVTRLLATVWPLILVTRLGSLLRNSVDRITDRAPHDFNVLTGSLTQNSNKHCLLEVFYTCLGIKERTIYFTMLVQIACKI